MMQLKIVVISLAIRAVFCCTSVVTCKQWKWWNTHLQVCCCWAVSFQWNHYYRLI